MQLIRNIIQAVRYHVLCTQDERIERMHFGLTDAERRENSRRKYVRNVVIQALAVLVLALVIIRNVGGV